MSERESVQLAPAFILHQRPYRNTSRLLECLTESHGRVTLVGRGVRRAERRQSATLQLFAPLRLSWVRRGELGRLTDAEPDGARLELSAGRLLAGFYLNELLLRLMARGDANGMAFAYYDRALSELAGHAHLARTIRLFELRFLRALGYGLALDCDTRTGEPIAPERDYLFELEQGPRFATGEGETYRGCHLISLREETLADDQSLRAAKRLLSRVLRGYLGDRPLKSSLVMRDIVEKGLSG